MDIDTLVLTDLVERSFNNEELEQLCHDLGIDYEELAGRVHSTKVRSLIGHMERRDRLEDLVEAIIRERPGMQGEFTPDIPTIPVIIAAMTAEEAQGMSGDLTALTEQFTIGESIYPAQQRNLERYQRFIQHVTPADLTGLLGNYDDRRDAWRPRGRETASALIHEMIERFGYEPLPLTHVVLSTDPADSAKRADTAVYLQQTSCLLVIDGMSLFHPRVRRLLSESGLVTASKTITTLLIAPAAPSCSDLAHRLEHEFKGQLPFRTIFHRFDEYDLLCDYGSFNQRNLKRWLNVVLPETAKFISGQDPNAERIERMKASVPVRETGIGAVIGGQDTPR